MFEQAATDSVIQTVKANSIKSVMTKLDVKKSASDCQQEEERCVSRRHCNSHPD